MLQLSDTFITASQWHGRAAKVYKLFDLKYACNTSFFPKSDIEVRCCGCTSFERQNIETGTAIAYCNDMTFSIRTFPFSVFEIVSSPLGFVEPNLPRVHDLMKSHLVSSESLACNHRQLVIENVSWPNDRRIMFLTQRRELQAMCYRVVVEITKPRWIDFPAYQIERDFLTQTGRVDSLPSGWEKSSVRSNERAKHWRKALDQQASDTGPTVGTWFACSLSDSDTSLEDRFALELLDHNSGASWDAMLYSFSEVPISRTGIEGQCVKISGQPLRRNDSSSLSLPSFEFAKITDVAPH